MVLHICKLCDYKSDQKCAYTRHLNSNKHKVNYIKNKKAPNTINDNVIIKKIELLTKEMEKLKEINQQLKENNIQNTNKIVNANNQNTHAIVKEARIIKKSLLSILNSNFKDTPSIDYIDEKEFKIHLEEEYNLKLDDKDNRLFMRIFSDFEKRKLIHSMSNVIIRFIKKEDQKSQSVFNIDSARGNYATKIEDIWHNDKKGLQMKKYTIDMMMKYMLNVMDIYRLKLLEMYNENKIKKNINVTDYIMEKQGLLLDVNAFITNPNTHKRIILNMCSELRLDDKFIE
jgi:hypothetical protein